MEQINTVEEFIERIKNKLSVSRVDIKIKFEWDKQNSKKLRFADLRFADLSSADLSSANLSFADLRSAEGEFIFNFGVKLKVVN